MWLSSSLVTSCRQPMALRSTSIYMKYCAGCILSISPCCHSPWSATNAVISASPLPSGVAAHAGQRLIGPKDCRALEAAALDVMVSVRKAAMAAIGRLLAEHPQDSLIADLWVTAVLPLVRLWLFLQYPQR